MRRRGDRKCAFRTTFLSAAVVIILSGRAAGSEITQADASRDASSGNAVLEDAIAPGKLGSSPDELLVKARPAGLEFLDDHLALGVGMTVQYDGSRGTDLGIASWSFRQDRYELATFRFVSEQTRRRICLSEPNWVVEASRRWRFGWKSIDPSRLQLFAGFGAAYKNKTDDLNGSRWNFAEQLGWRSPPLRHGTGRVEFAIRHISNAGLKKPNRGEDFLTLAYEF